MFKVLKNLCWSQVVNTTVKMQCYLNDKIQLTQNQKGPLSSLLLFQLFCSLGGTWGPFAFRSPMVGLWGLFAFTPANKQSTAEEQKAFLPAQTGRKFPQPMNFFVLVEDEDRKSGVCLQDFLPHSATLMSNWIVQHWDLECPEII